MGTGTDLVNSAINYTLGLNVENLTLTGAANLNGAGNVLNNIIRGNGGANILSGNAGNDTLSGGAGNDNLQGGLGNDTLNGGTGLDSFLFNTALAGNVDTITGFRVVDDTIRAWEMQFLPVLQCQVQLLRVISWRVLVLLR